MPNPLHITSANQWWSSARVYMGGPERYVRDASLSAGIPAETTASGTLGAALSYGATEITLGTGASSFLVTPAAVCITGTKGPNWYRYEGRSGSTLYGVVKIAGADDAIANGAAVSQMREITSLVSKITRTQALGTRSIVPTVQLEGTDYNSLVMFQDASVLITVSTQDDVLKGLGFTRDPEIWFQGFVTLPVTHIDRKRGTWRVNCVSWDAILRKRRITGGVRGQRILAGTWAGSPELKDRTQEPLEGVRPTSFAPSEVGDDSVTTLYISKDAPGASQIAGGPTGGAYGYSAYQYQTRSGFGPRITLVYPNPVDSPQTGLSRNSQQFFVIYNNFPVDPPNIFPFEDDVGTGQKATKNESQWGLIDVTGLQIILGGGRDLAVPQRKLYLNTLNGGPRPKVIIRPHTGCVICYDAQVWLSQWSLPEGWEIIETKGCSGWFEATNPYIPQMGAGAFWGMDPLGDYLALRGNPKWEDDSRFGGNITADSGTQLTVGSLSVPLTSWPSKGYIRMWNDVLVWYSSIDIPNSKLNVGTRWDNLGVTTRTVSGGFSLFQDQSFWWDFMAYGQPIIPKIPGDFPVRRVDGTVTDNQNTVGSIGEHQIGVWCNAGTDTPATLPVVYGDGSTLVFKRPQAGIAVANPWTSVPDVNKVAPAPALLEGIRRDHAMGGGRIGLNGDTGDWHHHDSNSAADWAVSGLVRIGNVDTISSFQYLEFTPDEHKSAFVVLDETAVVDTTTGLPKRRITVGNGEAKEYPTYSENPAIHCIAALIVGGATVYFGYTHRTASTFEGVFKIAAYGSTTTVIPPGTELKSRINTRAESALTGGANYIIKNLPALAGLLFERYLVRRQTRILAVGANYLQVPPGEAAQFPASGTLTVVPFQVFSGASATQNPVTYAVPYTGRSSDRFTGCTFPATMAEGWTIEMPAVSLSFPEDYEVLITRELNPVSPTIFLGSANTGWQTIFTGTAGNQVTVQDEPAGIKRFYIPLAGSPIGNPFFTKLVIRCGRMTNGERFKINRAKVFGYPYREQSSPGDPANKEYWRGTYRTGTIWHDILLEAGILASRIFTDQQGENVPSLPLATTDAWSIGEELAQMSGCLAKITPDGKIQFIRAPWMPGAEIHLPKYEVTPAVTVLPIDVQDSDRHAVAQVEMTGINPILGERYEVKAPTQPAEYGGEIVKLPSVVVPSQAAALAIVRGAFRRLNRGRKIKISAGPWVSDLEVPDIVPVNLAGVVDAAGRIPQGLYMIAKIEDTIQGKKYRSRLTLEEFAAP